LTFEEKAGKLKPKGNDLRVAHEWTFGHELRLRRMNCPLGMIVWRSQFTERSENSWRSQCMTRSVNSST
jgi:hypothetical protein